MSRCLCCDQPLPVADALSIGCLPASNRFGEGVETRRHPLQVTECRTCHLVQLLDPAPAEFVIPRVNWISYNEPAAHLPALAAQLQAHLPAAPKVLGAGPFDTPLLSLLSASAPLLDLSAWLPQQDGLFPYLESLQAAMRPEVMFACQARQDPADLVVCRYLLEHSHQPRDFLQALSMLLADGGKLLIEVPDASRFLAAHDYSFLWEEHLCYFTDDSLQALVTQAGFVVEAMWRFPGALEDALAILLRPADSPAALSKLSEPADVSTLFARFREGFSGQRRAWQRWFGECAAQGQRVAVFGAGHQAVVFLHAHGLETLIDCVIDDAPAKRGQIIPGTTLAVVSSSVLTEGRIDHCLLAVSPAAAATIRERFAGSCNFYPIFPASGEGVLPL